ncbi:CoA transferase [Zwartia hollandica]|jgi:crotonobetainyl-CoA:carnitine CoA-transferase CaiB-like acyl-CoA transferase|nr:CoA transferase [Zwartia hollandica]
MSTTMVAPSAPTNTAVNLLKEIWGSVHGNASATDRLSFAGHGSLPSYFAVTELAAASMGATGLALAELTQSLDVAIDRRLASLWFNKTISPLGWKIPPEPALGPADYRTRDGWIRLHTNAPHHRDAALRVLGTPQDPKAVAAAVSSWNSTELETTMVANGACAAEMRSWQDWQHHPQGRAVLAEPLLHWRSGSTAAPSPWAPSSARPLTGIKVLDMTRVLAGPAATRLLAGLGATVLRIDPPWWDEPSGEPEMSLGKRCTRLDLREAKDLEHWKTLLSEADVFVHGYRSDALSALGVDAEQRQNIRPGLIDVSLDAYGFTGPWKHRRGFDSLVQMSMGIAEAGQRLSGSDRPFPLPVQALDHGTGYLLATAILRALTIRVETGKGSIVKGSLARTGALLMQTLDAKLIERPVLNPIEPADWSDTLEITQWGSAKRLKWPVTVTGVEMAWSPGSGALGRHRAAWQD